MAILEGRLSAGSKKVSIGLAEILQGNVGYKIDLPVLVIYSTLSRYLLHTLSSVNSIDTGQGMALTLLLSVPEKL
jgi:hypothetical protein